MTVYISSGIITTLGYLLRLLGFLVTQCVIACSKYLSKVNDIVNGGIMSQGSMIAYAAISW